MATAYQSAIARHCGIEIESQHVQSTIGAALSSRSDSNDLTTSEEAEHAFWADLIHSLCPSPAGFQSCFDDLFSHFGSPDNWKCFADVQGLVQQLRTLGVTVAIASNFDKRLNSVCDGLQELQQVDCRIVSSLVGFRKPAPEFFAAVVADLGLKPQNILMVGDDVVNDIRGALQSGFQAALIDRSESVSDAQLPQLVNRLQTLGEIPELIERSQSVVVTEA